MEPLELLLRLSRTLDLLGLPYLVTGSMATITYGEPRFTNDIDVVIALQPNDVDRFCDQFAAPEFYLSIDAVRTAVESRRQFNIIHPTSGLKIDVFVPRDDDFERSRLSRGMRLSLAADIEVVFASAEDVILRKMQYFKSGGSEKHLRDIASMLKIQSRRIDREYISKWAETLGVSDVWQQIVACT